MATKLNSRENRQWANLGPLQDGIGHSFRDISLLQCALTHDSLLNETNLDQSDANERLEFLGDSVLGLVVSVYLYRRYPDRAEGDLHLARAAAVNTRNLSIPAEKLRLGDYIATGGGVLSASSRARSNVLGSCFEAVIGAVFVDAGYSTVEKFLLPWMDDFYDNYDFSLAKDSSQNKSRLNEYLVARDRGTAEYQLLEMIGPDHAPNYSVQLIIEGQTICIGKGTSVRRAEQDAAGIALNMFMGSDYVS
tara:strand:- start:162 stop:908 length:747 start_codon:yes stop_codon:yes gene_type:complete